MSFSPRPPLLATTLVLLSSLACGGARPQASVPEPASPARSTSQVLTATCRSMDRDAGTMDVITGVSFALRVVTFQFDDDTEVMVGGEPGEMDDLAPGLVVRIRYRTTSRGNQADRIEEVLDSTEMR